MTSAPYHHDLTTTSNGSLAAAGATDHPVAVYLASLAAGSRRAMRGALETIAAIASDERSDASTFPWSAMRHEHVAAIRAGLAERYAAATANRMLAALRGVLRSCWRLGLLDKETLDRAIDVPSVRGSTLPKGRSVSSGEMRAIFAACDCSSAGRRDAALLSLLYGGGLRRAEVVALNVGDLDVDTGELTVHGKGGRERLVHMTNGGLQAVLDWLDVRGTVDGPLLPPVLKGGRIQIGRRMTAQAVYERLRRLGAAAGVAAFSPHDLRRTFVSDLLDAGADISTVQQLAGHAQVTTTQRYDRRPERVKRRAAEMLHVPYERS